MKIFKTEQENFISNYKVFQAKIKNIDLDIEDCSGSKENTNKLEELKKSYTKEVQKINLFLQSLSELDRKIVILKYIENKSSKHIGDELNISVIIGLNYKENM
jgi:DNA-directed RNA polymerase specialized sigma24 family protein